MEKVNKIFRGSGKGKVAAICQVKDIISFKKNPVRTICLYHYWKFLTEYLKYDKVWIMANIATQDESLWECKNILKDLPIIFGTSKPHILEEYGVNDVWIHQSTPNFYGGSIFPQYPFNANRVCEWWQSPNHGDLFYIQDDPLFPNTNLYKVCNKRIFDLKNVYFTYCQTCPQELVDEEVKLLEKNRQAVEIMADEVIVAFCGENYEKFYNNIKDKNKPIVKYWDTFPCYTWQGMNDNLDNKLKDYPFDTRQYKCEYHGVTKGGNRLKVTTKYYEALHDKFMNVCGRSPFFKTMDPEKYDRHSVTEYYDLLQLICSSAKSTWMTHEDSILGNYISPRYFDSMLGDIINFVDIRFDPDKRYTDDPELKEFMYVSTPAEFAQKVDKIASDEKFYRHIKYLQRKSVYDKFKDFIEEENLPKYEEILKNPA